VTTQPGAERILVVGEALVEFVRTERGADLDGPWTYRGPYPSGAPAIAADAAALAGADVAFVSTVGSDPFGALVLDRLARDGVEIERIRRVAGATTGSAFVAYDDAGDRSFVFHVADAAPGHITSDDLAGEPERATWIHVSGATLALSGAMARVTLEAIERVFAHGGRLSLDPNLRPEATRAEEALGEIRRLCVRASLLFPDRSEAETLAVELEAAVRGGATVCVTRGREGVSVRHREVVDDIVGIPVEEVDPTGAGDTFAGVFLATFAAGADAHEAGVAANAAASSHVVAEGPMERSGWPSREGSP
jgi:sugar/nucleoside kinase (ribokinase family)